MSKSSAHELTDPLRNTTSPAHVTSNYAAGQQELKLAVKLQLEIEQIKSRGELDYLIITFLNNIQQFLTEVYNGVITNETKSKTMTSLFYAYVYSTNHHRSNLDNIMKEIRNYAPDAGKYVNGKVHIDLSIATPTEPIIYTYEYEKNKKVDFKYYHTTKESAEHIFDRFFYKLVESENIDEWASRNQSERMEAIKLNASAFLEYYVIPIIDARKRNEPILNIMYKGYILYTFRFLVEHNQFGDGKFNEYVKSLDFLRMCCENGGFLYKINENDVIKYYPEIKDQVKIYIDNSKREPFSMDIIKSKSLKSYSKEFLAILVEHLI